MNNFIIYPLVIMIVIGTFTQLYDDEPVNFSSLDTSDTYYDSINSTVNGTSQEVSVEDVTYDINFDMESGLIALIIAVAVLAVLGVSVLGSNLFSEFGHKMITNISIFYGLWAIFSVFSYDSIASIPSFGVLFWFILTFVYSMGVFSRISD